MLRGRRQGGKQKGKREAGGKGRREAERREGDSRDEAEGRQRGGRQKGMEGGRKKSKKGGQLEGEIRERQGKDARKKCNIWAGDRIGGRLIR